MEEVVISQISTNEFDLRRLVNGGTLSSQNGLFTVRVVKTGEGKTTAGRSFNYLAVQVVTKGIGNPVQRRDVEVRKVKGETVIKEVVKKPSVIKKKLSEFVDKVEEEDLL